MINLFGSSITGLCNKWDDLYRAIHHSLPHCSWHSWILLQYIESHFSWQWLIGMGLWPYIPCMWSYLECIIMYISTHNQIAVSRYNMWARDIQNYLIACHKHISSMLEKNLDHLLVALWGSSHDGSPPNLCGVNKYHVTRTRYIHLHIACDIQIHIHGWVCLGQHDAAVDTPPQWRSLALREPLGKCSHPVGDE